MEFSAFCAHVTLILTMLYTGQFWCCEKERIFLADLGRLCTHVRLYAPLSWFWCKLVKRSWYSDLPLRIHRLKEIRSYTPRPGVHTHTRNMRQINAVSFRNSFLFYGHGINSFVVPCNSHTKAWFSYHNITANCCHEVQVFWDTFQKERDWYIN